MMLKGGSEIAKSLGPRGTSAELGVGRQLQEDVLSERLPMCPPHWGELGGELLINNP